MVQLVVEVFVCLVPARMSLRFWSFTARGLRAAMDVVAPFAAAQGKE
jgi:hypothetical protein